MLAQIYITHISGFKSHLAHFQSKQTNKKKRPPRKNFQKCNILVLILQKNHIFSKESFCYIFPKEKFSFISGNKTLHFSDQDLKIKQILPDKISYTSGNGNPQKTLFISGKHGTHFTFNVMRVLKKNVLTSCLHKILMKCCVSIRKSSMWFYIDSSVQ